MRYHKFGISESQNSIWLPVDDSRYYFSTPQEKKEAREKCNQHAEELQIIIEAKIGRPLTQAECLKGCIEHQDTRNRGERVDAQLKWDAIFAPKKNEEDQNPHRKRLAAYLAEKERESDPIAYDLKKEAERWDEAQAERARIIKMSADPRRKKAVAHAQGTLLALKFDPRASLGEVEEAENRLRLAREGDLPTYEQLSNEFTTRYSSYLKELARPTQEKAAMSQSELKAMSQPFVLPPSETQNQVEVS